MFFLTHLSYLRYNISGVKRLGIYKAEKGNRWSRKSEGNLGRRGRRPHSSGGSVRDHYLRQVCRIKFMHIDFSHDVFVFNVILTYTCASQLPTSYSYTEVLEDPIPVPMTTRLRRQSEREQELLRLQLRKISSPPDTQTEPSLWTVEDVWAFIHSLPGICRCFSSSSLSLRMSSFPSEVCKNKWFGGHFRGVGRVMQCIPSLDRSRLWLENCL